MSSRNRSRGYNARARSKPHQAIEERRTDPNTAEQPARTAQVIGLSCPANVTKEQRTRGSPGAANPEDVNHLPRQAWCSLVYPC